MRSRVAIAMLGKRYGWKHLRVRLVVRRVGSREAQTRCGRAIVWGSGGILVAYSPREFLQPQRWNDR